MQTGMQNYVGKHVRLVLNLEPSLLTTGSGITYNNSTNYTLRSYDDFGIVVESDNNNALFFPWTAIGYIELVGVGVAGGTRAVG